MSDDLITLFGDPSVGSGVDEVETTVRSSTSIKVDAPSANNALASNIQDSPQVIPGGSAIINFSDELPSVNEAKFGAAGRVGEAVKASQQGNSSFKTNQISYSNDGFVPAIKRGASSNRPRPVVNNGMVNQVVPSEKSEEATTFTEPEVVENASSVVSRDSKIVVDLKEFDIKSLLARIEKFLGSSNNMAKISTHIEAETLEEYLEGVYATYFSSPRVSIGVSRLASLFKDYLEYSGTFEGSIVVDNINEELDSMQVKLPPKKEPNPEEKSLSEEASSLMFDIKKSILGKGDPIDMIDLPTDIDNMTILNSDTFLEKRANKQSFMLNSIEFENCKKFSCFKFDLFSVGGVGSKLTKGKASTAVSNVFKPCCSQYKEHGCPQSPKYNDQEQMIYDSALEAHGDKLKAHHQILLMRLKSI